MAGLNYRSLRNELIRRSMRYAEGVRHLYDDALTQIAREFVMFDYDPDVPFSFADFGKFRNVDGIMTRLEAQIQQVINNGIGNEFAAAYATHNDLIRSVLGENINEEMLRAFAPRISSGNAARTFIAENAAGNITRSTRVWNGATLGQMETAVQEALMEGMPAKQMAGLIEEYLNDPDSCFRRFRIKTGVDADGKSMYGRKWMKRVRNEDGSTSWFDADPRDYPVGQGVYHSSYKNALRYTRSTTNIAYRTADYERYQEEAFVLGIEIHTTSNPAHQEDICDLLAGRYPKDFKWTGWHPNCMCYEVPILATPEEVNAMADAIMNDQDPASVPVAGRVTDVPDNFKEWVANNEDRIQATIDRGKELPYFLRDNGTITVDEKLVDGELVPGNSFELKEFKQFQKVLSPLDIAAQRHAARTPQQIAQIQARADARQQLLKDYALTEKRAVNILNMASGWHEVSFVALQGAVDVVASSKVYRSSEMAELKKALQDTITQIKQQQAAEKALADIIPDVHKWHEKFTLAELQGAKDAVKKKVLDIQVKAGGDLAAQKKLMEKEMLYVSDGNYLKPHTLHKTWEVAQQSYLKQIGIMDEKIAWQPVEQSLAAIKSYSAANPKSLKIANLIAEAEKIKASGGSIASVMTKIAEAEKIKAMNEASVISHAKKAMKEKVAKLTKQKADLIIQKNEIELEIEKAKLSGDKALLKAKQKELKKVQGKIDKVDNELGNAGDIFSDAAYSDARKGVAQKFTNAPEADDYFHQYATGIWPKLTDEEKEALWGYTAGSGYITEPLRAINGHYYYYSNRMAETEKHIRALTTALDKCALKEDVFIKRDDAAWGVEYVFGIKDLSKYQSNPKALVGMVGTDESFISCSSCKNTFFTATGRKDVIYNIYCPKGTKGTYCEPFSSCGTYGRRWDGTRKSNPSNRNENEFLLQRGTKYRITGAKYDAAADKWIIDIEVIGQLQRDFVMKMGSGGYYCEFL